MIFKDFKILVCLLVMMPVAVHAEENLKEKADRICRAYIDSPDAFKEITEVHDCRHKVYPQEDPWEMQCFDFEMLDKTKTSFAFTGSGGTCSGRHAGIVGEDSAFKWLHSRNAEVNGYGFGGRDSAFEYEGELFFSYGHDIRMLVGEENVILCNFLYEWQGWSAAEPQDNEICRSFESLNYEVIAKPVAKEEWSLWPKYPDAGPEEVYLSDINRDGTQEQIVRYNYASGSACGCDSKVLVVVKENQILPPFRGGDISQNDLSEAESILPRALNKSLKSCKGIPFSVIRIEGKDYVLTDYNDPQSKEADIPPVMRALPERALYEFHDGEFKKICSQSSKGRKRIAHEVYPESQWWRLNYKPLQP